MLKSFSLIVYFKWWRFHSTLVYSLTRAPLGTFGSWLVYCFYKALCPRLFLGHRKSGVPLILQASFRRRLCTLNPWWAWARCFGCLASIVSRWVNVIGEGRFVKLNLLSLSLWLGRLLSWCWLLVLLCFDQLFHKLEVNGLPKLRDHWPNIIHICQVLEQSQVLVQLNIIRVFNPGSDGQSIGFVEEIRDRRVVKDNDVL